MFDPYFISENERWIKGWRGYYSITRNAIVYSYHNNSKTVRENVPNPRTKNVFRAHVNCSYNNNQESVSVAKAMYEAFVRPLADDETLIPINGDIDDLRLENMMPVNLLTVSYRKEYLLENINTGELICFAGYDAAKEYGLNGRSICTKICNALSCGKDYFTLNKNIYRFLVA